MIDYKKITSKVESDQSFLEYVAKFIPGYGGYRDSEKRREIDGLLRKMISSALGDQIKEVRWIQKELINSGSISEGKKVETVIIQADILSNKVLHSKLGYSSIWKTVKTGDAELNGIIIFDVQLLEKIQMMREILPDIRNSIHNVNSDETGKLIEKYEIELRKFESQFNERDEVILGLANGGNE